jgi:hypothetical protein
MISLKNRVFLHPMKAAGAKIEYREVFSTLQQK